MKSRPRARQKLVAPAEFAVASRKGQVPHVAVLAAVEMKTDDAGVSTMDFVMSTATPDRMGDTIDQGGWDVSNFVKNPVLLWAHDYGCPPVGKVGGVVVEDGKLKAKGVEFVPREVSEFGWSIGEMFRRGFLTAVSVGFAPKQWTYRDDGGIDFLKQELLELSAVPVPANAEALVEAKGLGLWTKGHDEWLAKARGGVQTSARTAGDEMPPEDEGKAAEDEEGDDEIADLSKAIRDLAEKVAENTAAQKSVAEAITLQVAALKAATPVEPEEPAKGAAAPVVVNLTAPQPDVDQIARLVEVALSKHFATRT